MLVTRLELVEQTAVSTVPSGAAITYVAGSATVFTSGTGGAANLPAGMADNDYVLACVEVRSFNAAVASGAGAIGAPAGFVLIREQSREAPPSLFWTVIYARPVLASESGAALAWGWNALAANSDLRISYRAYRGVDFSAALANGAGWTVASLSSTTGAVTTVSGNSRVIQYATWLAGTAGTQTQPAGYGNVVQGATASTNKLNFIASDATFGAGISTSTPASTSTQSLTGIGMTVVLLPLATSAVTTAVFNPLLNLWDGSAYSCTYTPQPAPPRRDALADAPYQEVTETITINVYGCSASEATQRLTALLDLLERAERWAMGENAQAAVLLRAWVQGDDQPYDAALLGLVDDQPYASLQPTWDQEQGRYAIRNVTITIRRMGVWLGAIESAVMSVTNGEVGTLTWPSQALIASPTDITISEWQSYTQGFVVLADETTDIAIIQTETSATDTIGGGITTATVAGALARGGSFQRFSSAAGVTWILRYTIPPSFRLQPRFAVYAIAGPQTPGTLFQAQAALSTSNTIISGLVPISPQTPLVTIATGASGLGEGRQPYLLGILDAPAASLAGASMVVDVIVPNVPAAALEIDALLLVSLTPDALQANTVAMPTVLGAMVTVAFNRSLDTVRLPQVYRGGLQSYTLPPYWARGDTALFTRGQTTVITIQGTNNPALSNTWRWTRFNATSGPPVIHNVIARRRRGHRLPGGA